MDLSALGTLDPATLRAILPAWLADAIDDPDGHSGTAARLADVAGAWSDDTCASLVDFLATLGEEHRVYTAHPACREVSRAWCRSVLLEPRVEGIEHLVAALERGPTMLVGNHLSYIDANATDALLAWGGHADIADRIIAVAGPKVYQDLFRRFAAGCLSTLPVPQSTTLGHTEKLSPRELARRAKTALDAARDSLQRGQIVLLYPEGSRSRSGRLQPFVRGVHRWLSAVDGLQLVPVALVGTGQVMRLGSDKSHPASVHMRIGQPLQVGRDGTSREVLVQSHGAVAALLPLELRPAADTSATE